MASDLQANLKTKKELRFNKKGKFKILTISDIQETNDFNPQTLDAIEKILDAEKPDLLLLLGDNCNGLVIKSAEELKKYVTFLNSIFEKHNTPWAHIWGNHDHDVGIDEALQESIYSGQSYCLSRSADGVTGQSNFVLPVYSSKSDKIKFNVWGLDTGNVINDFAKESFGYNYDIWSEVKDLKGENPYKSIFGIASFDRVCWYFNTSVEMEKFNEDKIPALMVTHMAPLEIVNILKNKRKCHTKGYSGEHYGLGTFNNGLFAAMLQRQDVKTICSGHTHCNDVSGDFCGIKICNDASIGYSAYGDDERRGGRIFEIDEKNPEKVKTRMVYIKDLV